jgi:CMP-N,N'-diacetyllegionaminic acid synthase
LLHYTIQAAWGSRRLTRTVLSSEDQEIRGMADSLGVEAPFIRPAELATDDATSVSVAKHALGYVEDQEGKPYDFVCLLQPTCPLRTSQDVDCVIEMLEQSDADGIVSVCKVEEPHPFKMLLVTNGITHALFPDQWRENLRRQELPPTFYLNGAVYCVRRNILAENDSLWGNKTLAYIMPAERSVNIDTGLDLKFTEVLLNG